MSNNAIRDAVLGHLRAPVGWFPITPSDTADLPRVARRLRCTAAGDVAFLMADREHSGTTVRVLAMAAGDTFDGDVVRVMETDTTATVQGEY